MIFKPNDSDYEHLEDEDDDFFEVSHAEEEKPKEPKKPDLSPEDPKYWDEDEEEFEHLKPKARNWRLWAYLAAGGVAFGLLISLYLTFFSPYVDHAVQYGYVEHIAREGDVFKTFEGVLMPYKSISDTIVPYQGDIRFSAENDHVAAELLRLRLANLPARVEYKIYHAPLPWRGSAKVVITQVDTADPRKIFPPQIQHPLIPHP